MGEEGGDMGEEGGGGRWWEGRVYVGGRHQKLPNRGPRNEVGVRGCHFPKINFVCVKNYFFNP